MCPRSHGARRVWLIVYLKVCTDYQLVVFFLSKLVLTMINLGESFSYITFLVGNVFSRRTEKYRMLVMSSLCKYLKDIVVTMHQVIYLTVRIFLLLLISATCSSAAEMFTTKTSISSYIVL